MADMIQRLHYFDRQLLHAADFDAEQRYHVAMRRLHNRLLHTWGIASGLELTSQGDAAVGVEPGVAIDRDGNEIYLMQARSVDLPAGSNPVYVTISYGETPTDPSAETGVVGETRWTEDPQLDASTAAPAGEDVGRQLVLGRLLRAGSGGPTVDDGERRRAGAVDLVMETAIADGAVSSRTIQDGAVRGQHILDGSITPQKLAFAAEDVGTYCLFDGAAGPGGAVLDSRNVAGVTKGTAPGFYTFALARPVATTAPLLVSAQYPAFPGAPPVAASVIVRDRNRVTVQAQPYGTLEALVSLAVLGPVPVTLPPEPAPAVTFEAATSAAVGTNPRSLAVADLTGDGAVDIVALTPGSTDVSILVNKGDGTFADATRVGLPSYTWSPSIAAADLRRNGRIDLVVPVQGASAVAVLLGNGDGTFAPAANYPVGAYPYDVVVGDTTGDDIPDIVVTTSAGELVSFVGAGDGTFKTDVVRTPLGGAYVSRIVRSSAAGQPLAVVGPYGDVLYELTSKGDASFAVARVMQGVATNYGISDLVAADLNRDGRQDLALVVGGFQVLICLRNADGTLSAGGSYFAGYGLNGIVAADLTRDGNVDLVVSSWSDTIAVLPGRGDGTFAPALLANHSPGVGIAAAALGDFNRDGRLDIAYACQTTNTVGVLRQSRPFVFPRPIPRLTPTVARTLDG